LIVVRISACRANFDCYLVGDDFDAGPMEQLLGSSITYRIAVGPQQGRKVFTLQTLPAYDEPFDTGVGKVAEFSLHAGVAARADQRQNERRGMYFLVLENAGLR